MSTDRKERIKPAISVETAQIIIHIVTAKAPLDVFFKKMRGTKPAVFKARPSAHVQADKAHAWRGALLIHVH